MDANDVPSDPHDGYPDEWETFYRDGEAWGRTDDGKEFKFDTGSSDPVDGRCNEVCRDSLRRYGEIRHCTMLPESTFVEDGSDRCKTHKNVEALIENAAELVKTGAFGRSYVVFSKAMEPLEFVSAIEMFDGLLEQSKHDFETEYEVRSIDTTEEDLIEETDVTVMMPFPMNETYSFQAKELWQAALDEVKSERMQHMIFSDGVSQKTLVDSADMEGKITDIREEKTEHSLHLPISRLSKDIKERLKNGGVPLQDEEEGGLLTFKKNNYTLDIEPSEEDLAEAEEIGADDFTTELTDE